MFVARGNVLKGYKQRWKWDGACGVPDADEEGMSVSQELFLNEKEIINDCCQWEMNYKL